MSQTEDQTEKKTKKMQQQLDQKHPAHLGSRSCAFLIDVTLYIAVYVFVFIFIIGIHDDDENEEIDFCALWTPDDIAIYMICVLLPGAFVVFCYIKWGASVGKRCLGLRVVDASTGESPKNRQFVTRVIVFDYILWQAFLLSCSTRDAEEIYVILLLVFACHIACSVQKRGIHDWLAHTIVVHRGEHCQTQSTPNSGELV